MLAVPPVVCSGLDEGQWLDSKRSFPLTPHPLFRIPGKHFAGRINFLCGQPKHFQKLDPDDR